jgi:hypothetical protein
MRVAALAFFVTLAVILLPWVAWFGIDIYLLGRVDPKLGRDAYFLFGVGLRAATGLTSAVVAVGVHMVEMMYPEPLPWRSRKYAVLLAALALSALSPIVPQFIMMDLGDVAGQVVPWALLSLLCVQSAVVGAHWAERVSRGRAAQR